MTGVRAVLAALFVAAFLAAVPVAAQSVGECDWRASAIVIAEPWEGNTRTYANGDIRVALLDAGEPAAGPFHLLVLFPGTDDEPWRHCAVVSLEGGMGFFALDFPEMKADYDPTSGLRLFAFTLVKNAEGNNRMRGLSVRINQATGVVRAEFPIE